MYCKNCGTKLDEDTVFCSKCGTKQNTESKDKNKKKNRIKCINCKYIGEGQKGRSMWAVILACLCIPFMPIITILYFLFSHKWICPRCKSKFIEEIDENGNVIKRRNILLIIVIIFIGIAIMGILASVILVSLGSARAKARDAKRESDIRQISLAMEMYYDDNYDRYLQLATIPMSIGIYLNPVPTDLSGGPCPSYEWISNLNDSQRFCVYACLEEGTFFAASGQGTQLLDKAPTSLNCW